MLECVANVSEGRSVRRLRAVADSCGASLVDVHSDPDHHRSVFTLAGPGPDDAGPVARDLAGAVAAHISIVEHVGVHPRLGALDVVPFVALGGSEVERAQAADAAREFGKWWAETREVPVFFYDDADPGDRDLPDIRRHAFKTRMPDFGPDAPHPALGATAVGARKPLVAVNLLLVTGDLAVARRIAAEVRERDGGLPGVRALGLMLESQGQPQVSMNLVDLDRTGIEDACLAVRELARHEHTDVASVEVVGLVPRTDLDRCSDEFLTWAGIDASATIEARVGHGPRRLPGEEASAEA
ncbi:MAG: glutamate formiminotransferase / 5-formyltetrahydrofolate cyclo-ligase [Actinomycetota bacterium]|nr:glutamate formiminotransferase / 5-formyltetrahydrofolate cyclo-ligase [Actinomycetota bacterium]